MAASGRFQRRILANAFIEFYEKALSGQRGTRFCLDPENKENAYIFCAVPYHTSFSSNERYREVRRGMIQDYCAINKYLNKQIKNIFGIAFKTREKEQYLSSAFFNEGQDFVFFQADDWVESDYLEAKIIYEEYVSNGLLAERGVLMERITEFPEGNSGFRTKLDVKGKDRNKPCVCGSGKKIKKCCGWPKQ
jgi:hypothetical protein